MLNQEINKKWVVFILIYLMVTIITIMFGYVVAAVVNELIGVTISIMISSIWNIVIWTNLKM